MSRFRRHFKSGELDWFVTWLRRSRCTRSGRWLRVKSRCYEREQDKVCDARMWGHGGWEAARRTMQKLIDATRRVAKAQLAISGSKAERVSCVCPRMTRLGTVASPPAVHSRPRQNSLAHMDGPRAADPWLLQRWDKPQLPSKISPLVKPTSGRPATST